MKEVAKLANVSIATVSRVLAGNMNVNPNLRDKVFKAIDQLGYTPSRVARSLRMQSSKIIGLVISDIQNPFFTSLVRAVEDTAFANNYGTLLCNSDEDINKENYYLELLLSEQVAGVVITPTRETHTMLKKFINAKIPVVSVDRIITDIDVDTVIVDNVKGSRDLINYLIENGHTRIAAILGSMEITTGRSRYQGYTEILATNHIYHDKSIIRNGSPKKEFGYQSTMEILRQTNRPSAILAGNNLITLGVLQAIRELRLNIPEDISLVAFDDMEWTSLVDPPITVIKQPIYQLGSTAIDLLIKRIQDPDRATLKVVLGSPIIVRKSVRKIEN